MTSPARAATRGAVLYSLGGLLQRASSIIFFPLFSAHLTARDYGTLSVTQSVASVVTLLAFLELPKALTRFVHHDRSAPAHRALLGSVLAVQFLVASAGVTLLLLAGHAPLVRVLNDIPFWPPMAVTLLALPFLGTYQLFRAYLQSTEQSRTAVLVDLAFFASNVGLNLVFVVGFEAGALGIIVSTLISALAFAGFALVHLARTVGLSVRRERLRAPLSYGLSLVPFTALGMLVETADLFLLNARAGSAVSGIYYIAVTLAGFFSVVKESVNVALLPWFFQRFDTTSHDTLDRVGRLACAAVGLVAVGISWFGFEVLVTLSRRAELVDGWRYAPLLVGGLFVVFVGQVVNLPTYHTRTHVKYLSLSTLAALGCVAPLAAWWVRPFGAYGAAAAKLVGFSVMTLIMVLIARRASPFRPRWGRLGLVVVGVLALVAVPYLAPPSLPFTLAKAAAYAAITGLFLVRWGRTLWDVARAPRQAAQ